MENGNHNREEREGMLMRKSHHSREKQSSENRGSSAGEWATNKFDKIFTTLNQMKTNLNDCKKLRESKSGNKSKQKHITESKGNLVNTKELRVKSKKTHE